jgi:hypothetical protein
MVEEALDTGPFAPAGRANAVDTGGVIADGCWGVGTEDPVDSADCGA